MPVTRIRFWLFALILICYIIGVVILSAISLHGIKNGNIALEGFEPGATPELLQIPKRLKGSVDYRAAAFRPILQRSKIHWCSELKFIKSEEARKRKPVALVSFPGSGNTWLRYLLQQATGFFTGSVYKDYGLLKNGFPAESVTTSAVLVVKTHEWGPKSRDMFSKAILLIRAPDESIHAEFNRQSGGHIGFASFDRYRRNKGKYWHQFVDVNLKNWQQLHMDWLQNFTGPLRVIFYEQLVNNTETTLTSLINFLEVDVPKKSLDCAMERKEGIYRRRKRFLNFNPFSNEMTVKINEAKDKVYEAINKIAPQKKR